jgi:hypothetical protein
LLENFIFLFMAIFRYTFFTAHIFS